MSEKENKRNNHPKSLAKTQHVSGRRLLNKLPMHDVIRRRPDGSASQMFNMILGEGLQQLDNEIERYQNVTSLHSCPTDELSALYLANVPPEWNRDLPYKNQLANSDFEAICPSGEMPYDWTFEGIAAYSSGEVSTSGNYTQHGSRCLEVTLDPGDGISIYQEIDNFEASYVDPLSATFFAKLKTGTVLSQIRLEMENAVSGDWNEYTQSTTIQSGYEWERITANFNEARPAFTKTRFHIDLWNNGTSTAIVMIDSAQLEIGSLPSLWRRKRNDNYPLWNITDTAGEFDIYTNINSRKQPLFFCDNFYDFYDRAVPTRAEIHTSTLSYRFISALTEYNSHPDTFGDEWRSEFKIISQNAPVYERVTLESITGNESNYPDGTPRMITTISKDGNGDTIYETRTQIVKENKDIPTEYLASYDLMMLSVDNIWEIYPASFLYLTMIKDLLAVLIKENEEYYILIVNPQHEIPERSHLFLLNKLKVSGLSDILPSGFTLDLGVDEYDENSLALRIVDTDADTTTNYKIKLWYDYWMFYDNQTIAMRENYEDYGGVTIN